MAGRGTMAQIVGKADTINFKKLHFTNSKFINNLFRQAVNSVSRNPGDDNYGWDIGKSEAPYLKYQGKVIRNIDIQTIPFGGSVRDKSKGKKNFTSKVGNRLHTNTKQFVIKDNLFIRENTPLNAYMVADNERYLRSREYIQDARIEVLPIKGNPDSVDIRVYTKDLFSIAGGAASDAFNHINGNVYEANLAGMAQRIEFNGLFDYNRSPNFGYGGLYRKLNVFHSYIDATIGYNSSNISPYTREEETTQYLSLTRNLVSPYSRFAGGLVLSHNEAYNIYHAPENIIYKYSYDLFDGWAGYNLGIKKLTAKNNTIRDRHFLALRVFDRKFNLLPKQVTTFDPVFNNSRAVLAQFTFFRQEYFKTQYIYGFGTTEDLPYGYNISLTGGWHEQWINRQSLKRPYAGLNINHYITTKGGDFIQLYLRTGAFMHDGQIQDASYLVGATAWSRLFFLGSTKIRQYVNASYTHLYDRVTYAPLHLNNEYGPRGFLTDSAYGSRRLSIQLETEFYLKFKFLGFQFAPFPYGDLSLISGEHQQFNNASLYTSIGGGVRARNPNLVFETIEVRAFFFPVAPANMKGFKVVVNANLRYKYSSNYISAPNLVQLN